jgi:hypothetical protein
MKNEIKRKTLWFKYSIFQQVHGPLEFVPKYNM